MTILILCRHGESEGNQTRRFGGQSATPLTERGRRQARAVARVLANARVSTLYTSDLERAMETANFIADATGIAPRSSPALRERCVGAMTGLTFAEAETRYPDALAALLRRDADARPPGGETYRECQARAVSFLEDILRQHDGGSIVLVSHNITLYFLTRYLMGLEQAEKNHGPSIDNCALHRFERSTDVWKVLALNERDHLPSV